MNKITIELNNQEIHQQLRTEQEFETNVDDSNDATKRKCLNSSKYGWTTFVINREISFKLLKMIVK